MYRTVMSICMYKSFKHHLLYEGKSIQTMIFVTSFLNKSSHSVCQSALLSADVNVCHETKLYS